MESENPINYGIIFSIVKDHIGFILTATGQDLMAGRQARCLRSYC